jgi:hypothetical protein
LKKPAVAVLSALSLYSAAHFYVSGIRQPLHNFYSDFLGAFPSWRLSMLLGRMDFYRGSLAEVWATMFRPEPLWHYGPIFHLITLPLFAFPDLHSAYVAWLFATYAFFVCALAVAWRAFDLRGVRWIAILGILNFVPMYEALTQRNIEIFELLLIFGAFALLRKGHQMPAGVLIGLAAMAKFLPLIFIPYFAVKRMWRALAASLITAEAIAVAAEAVFGWSHSGILVQLRQGSFLRGELNQSLSGMIIRLLQWTHAYSRFTAATLSRVAILASLAGLSWLFLKTRDCRGIEDLEWATLIVAMVLLPPHNQQYYLVLLIFPFLALLARRVELAWLAVAFFLAGAPLPFRIFGANAFSAYLRAGIPFVGASLLGILCVRALRHAPCT